METMLEVGPLSKGVDYETWYDSKTWSDHKRNKSNSILICDDARKRLMPKLDPTKTYNLRFYKKKPRCKVTPVLFRRKKHELADFTLSQWKEDKPHCKWKDLGGLQNELTNHFKIAAEPVRLYIRVIESKRTKNV